MSKKTIKFLASIPIAATAVIGLSSQAQAAPPDINIETGRFSGVGRIAISQNKSTFPGGFFFDFQGVQRIRQTTTLNGAPGGAFAAFDDQPIQITDVDVNAAGTVTKPPIPFTFITFQNPEDTFILETLGAVRYDTTPTGVSVSIPVTGNFTTGDPDAVDFVTRLGGEGIFSAQFVGETEASLLAKIAAGTVVTTQSYTFELNNIETIPGPAILPASIIGGAFLRRVKSNKKKALQQ